LTTDQQAMLQLLLERGQSYADLASVLGVDEAQVCSRAREALTELGGTDPDRNVGLTDYLLGQADPIGRADAVRHLKDDPEDLSLATELSQKLLLVAPEADLPRLPGEERRPRPRRAGNGRGPFPKLLRRGDGASDAAATGPRTLTRRQGQLAVLFGCVGVLLVVGILAVAGAFGGGGDAATTTTTAATRTLATVALKPQTSTNAAGAVRFGIQDGQQAFVDVGLRGLKPAPEGQTYVIWLLLTPNQGYPLSPIRPCGSKVPEPCLSQTGSYENRFQLPPATLTIVSRTRFVDVSMAPTDQVRSAISSAIKQNQLIIQRPGTTVLRGAIPEASRSRGAGGSNGG
jgi:hypothetical protein